MDSKEAEREEMKEETHDIEEARERREGRL
jgi:hypothetical protein